MGKPEPILRVAQLLPACPRKEGAAQAGWPCAGEERRETAGRCLGELVRKMGERVLRTIIPILAEGMQAPKVCTAPLSWAQPEHCADSSLGGCAGLLSQMTGKNRACSWQGLSCHVRAHVVD